MPLPRNNKNEFFIPDINPFYIDEVENQAIIDDYFLSPSWFTIFFDSDIDERVNINDLDCLYMHTFYIHYWANYQNSFYLNVMEIFSKNISSTNLTAFSDYLKNFIRTKANYDELLLTNSFICDVCVNNEILDLLKKGSFTTFQKDIFMYHGKLLLRHYLANIKNAKKNLFKQFKEFKIHRNYCGQKANRQENNNYMINKNISNFINQHKNRKISHLRRAINI